MSSPRELELAPGDDTTAAPQPSYAVTAKLQKLDEKLGLTPCLILGSTHICPMT